MIKRTCLLLLSIALFSASPVYAAFPDDFDGVILEATGEASGIRTWAKTATLNFTVTENPVNSFGRGLIIDNSHRNIWRAGGGNVSCCNANAWIFAKFGGRWYGHTFEFVRVGQNVKSEAALKPNHFKGAPPWVTSFNYNTTGAVYGFMSSGLSRNGPAQVNVRERSNISFYRWNVGPISACEAVPENPNCGPPPPEEKDAIIMTPITDMLLQTEAAAPPVDD